MILYGLKTCDTCRAAMKSLDGAEFRDVRADGVPSEVLWAALEKFGDRLINTRSTTWRGLSAEDRQRPPQELLAAHPALMKRPLVVAGHDLYLGWDKSVQAALVG